MQRVFIPNQETEKKNHCTAHPSVAVRHDTDCPSGPTKNRTHRHHLVRATNRCNAATTTTDRLNDQNLQQLLRPEEEHIMRNDRDRQHGWLLSRHLSMGTKGGGV